MHVAMGIISDNIKSARVALPRRVGLQEALRTTPDPALFCGSNTQPCVAKTGGASIADLYKGDVMIIQHD